MGTKIHCKSYLPGFYSMRDLNDDSSSSSWPVFYGDKQIPNGQYYNGFMQRNLVDGYPGHDKDALKQKMLEHEAVFKNQVCELHRLYRIQRDMMEEVKRKDTNKNRASMEPASSSSFHGPQLPLEEAKKWHMAGFPLLNSSYGRTPISGVEIVKSPMSCVKTNIAQPNHFLFQSGPTSKDSEGSRPLKVRKKLFDLQLPADEYIDVQEGESSKEYKESENSVKLFLGGHGLKGSNGLADLNEPIQIEEATDPLSVDFFGRTENSGTKGVDWCAKPNASYFGVSGENIHARNGFSISSPIESKVNTRGRVSNICDAGATRSNLSFATQGPVQGMLNQVHSPATYLNGYNREDMWRDGLRNGLEPSGRNPNQTSKNYHLEPIASRAAGSYPFVSSSCFATSWAQSVSSWAKPTSNFVQNVTTLETPSKPLLFQRSESTSNWKTSAGFDYLNCSKGDNVASDRSTNHGFGIPKAAIDINLNEVLSNEIVIPQDLNGKSNPEDHLSALPWLKPKPVTDSKVTLASDNPETPENRIVKKILGIPIFERLVPEKEPLPLASTSASVHTRTEVKNITSERKNGLIDINVACEPDEQIAAEEEPTSEKEKPKLGTSVRDHIDLNSCVSDCEEPPPPYYERKTASVKITLEIDLEVPIFLESEDDDRTLSKENIIQNKDEQIKDDALRNAAETIFAISSSGPQVHPSGPQIDPSEASLAEALLWFVDAVSNESRPNKNCSPMEIIDDFEAMTLQLAETKEEDYMPKPFILETPKTEEENGALPTRPRRGQARRGRQRRDFQRDILPGLTTLSRHEVTEDLQTFGGLMRATGHSWSSGLARRNGARNGGGRGRRRTVVVENVAPSAICTTTTLVKQLNSNNHHVEGGLEDRSLTGWGKTTRRPRRQRCPAGNISTIVIT